jgi:hypothetical protein
MARKPRDGDTPLYDIAELSAAFARRRCGVCGAPTRVICVGIDPAPDTDWCLRCAAWLTRQVDDSGDNGERSKA